jgi:hypothetical protein
MTNTTITFDPQSPLNRRFHNLEITDFQINQFGLGDYKFQMMDTGSEYVMAQKDRDIWHVDQVSWKGSGLRYSCTFRIANILEQPEGVYNALPPNAHSERYYQDPHHPLLAAARCIVREREQGHCY